MKNETHHLDLGNGTHIAVLLDFHRYKKTGNAGDIVRVKRTGPEIPDEMLDQYKNWMHELNTTVAKVINANHLYMFISNKDIQCFIYKPDGTKEEEPVPDDVKQALRRMGTA